MMEFKGCPRCRGDVMTSKDIYGVYKECLQCGYIIDVGQPMLPRRIRRLAPINSDKEVA